MKALVGFGVLAGVGYTGYADTSSFPSSLPLPNTNDQGEALVEEELKSDRSEAEHLALAFAKRLEDLHDSVKAGTLDSSTLVAMRDDISHRFEAAFSAISELEENGELAEAALARAIIQNAIDYHMQAEFAGAMSITGDLDLYSVHMTETLIDRSVALSA